MNTQTLSQIVCQENRCTLGKGEYGYCLCSSYVHCQEYQAWKDADRRKARYNGSKKNLSVTKVTDYRGREDLSMWEEMNWEHTLPEEFR